jgi:hypothetical protein
VRPANINYLNTPLQNLPKEMRYFVAFFIALLVPFAIAADPQIIDKESVKFTGGLTPGDFIRPNTYVQSQLSFKINEPYDNIVVQLGTLNDRNEQFPASVSICNGRVCSFPVTLKISGTGAFKDASFTVKSGSEQQVLNYRFNIDTVVPTLKTLGTASCTASCAVKQGENTIVAYFVEQGSGMNPSTVFLLTPSPVQATSCEKDKCSFSVTLPANVKELTFSVQAGAKDYAGNSVGPTQPTKFVADNTAPVIEAVTTSFKSGTTITGPFELRVQVKEQTPFVGTAVLTGFTGEEKTVDLSCKADLCTYRVVPELTTGTATAKITITDAAGNTVTQTTNFILAGVSHEKGDFWTVTGTAKPARLDKGTAKLFSKKIYIPLTYDGSDAIRSYTAPPSCSFWNAGEKVSLVVDVDLIGATSAPVIVLTMDPSVGALNILDDLTGDLKITCKVVTYSSSNGEFFEKGEEDEFSTTVKLVENPLITTQYKTLQQQSQERYDKGKAQLKTYQDAYKLGLGLCTAMSVMRSAEATTDVVQGSTAGEPLVGNQVATVARATSFSLSKAATALQDSDYGYKLCAAIACRDNGFFNSKEKISQVISPLKNAKGQTGTVFNTIAEASSGSADNFVDPYKSEYVAYASACLPAIVYHQQMKQSFLCQYNQCVKQQVVAGVPISACAAQLSTQTCRYNAGSAFYASPLAPLQIIRDNFITIVGSPYAFFGYISPLVCEAVPDNLQNALCKIPKAIKQFSGMRGMVANMQQYANTFSQQSGTTCETPPEPLDPLTRTLAQGVECRLTSCCYKGYCNYGGNLCQITTTGTVSQGGAERAATGHNLNCGLTIDELEKVPNDVKTVLEQSDIKRRTEYVNPAYDQALETYTLERNDIVKKQAELRQKDAKVKTTTTAKGAIQTASCFTQGYATCANNYITALEQSGVTLTQEQKTSLTEHLRILDPSTPESGYGLPYPDGSFESHDGWTESEIRDLYTQFETDSRRIMRDVGTAAVAATKAEIRRNDKELKEQLKVIEAERRKAEEAAYIDRLGTDKHFLMSEMATTGVAAYQLSSLFGQNNKGFVFGNIPELDNRLTDFEQKFADRVCRGGVRKEQSIIGLTSTGAVGMYLHGSRTAVSEMVLDEDDQTVPTDPTFQYLVGGQVALEEKTEGTFTIYLQKGGSTTEPLFEGNLAEQNTYSWTSGKLITHESTEKYDDVCVEFAGKSVNDVFASRLHSGSKVCVPLGEVTQ